MKNYVVKTSSEIKNKVSEPKKKTSFWSKFFDVVLIVALGIAIVVSGTAIYLKLRYVSCYVSGMSMFPTLNMNALNPDGQIIKPTNSGETCEVGSKVDYLLADDSKDYKESIKRFDIVCSYYSEDYTGDTLKSTAAQKIKRVIGLPGETIWLVTSSIDESKYCGRLFVTKDQIANSSDIESIKNKLLDNKTLQEIRDDGYTYNIEEITQPLSTSFYDAAVKEINDDQTSTYSNGAISYSYAWQLNSKSITSDGEYIFLGDNRKNSHDSRDYNVSKVKGEYVQAKVIAKIGQGKITSDDSATLDFFSFHWRKL